MAKEKFKCENCQETFYDYHSRKFCSHQCYWEWLRGKKHSSETRRKQKKALKEWWANNPETKDRNLKISLAMKGKKLSLDHKKKALVGLEKAWNKNRGKHRSEETKERIRQKLLGKELSKKHRLKLSLAAKKRVDRPRGKEHYLFGKHHTEEWKKKQSRTLKGENNPQWRGGLSFKSYDFKFNNELKEEIRERDNYRCQECFRHQNELFKNTKAGWRPYKLHIHHIDYGKKNCDPDNLISLCLSCHVKTNFKREDWIKYFKSNGSNKMSRIIDQRK